MRYIDMKRVLLFVLCLFAWTSSSNAAATTLPRRHLSRLDGSARVPGTPTVVESDPSEEIQIYHLSAAGALDKSSSASRRGLRQAPPAPVRPLKIEIVVGGAYCRRCGRCDGLTRPLQSCRPCVSQRPLNTPCRTVHAGLTSLPANLISKTIGAASNVAGEPLLC